MYFYMPLGEYVSSLLLKFIKSINIPMTTITSKLIQESTISMVHFNIDKVNNTTERHKL
jgi:hypothetical protein